MDPARAAGAAAPGAVAVDGAGNVYFADQTADVGDGPGHSPEQTNNVVRRVAPDGQVTTVAGNGTGGFSGDGGPATEAGLVPGDIDVDADGTLYIADSVNHRIRKVGLDGVVSTPPGGADLDPLAIAADHRGNLFVLEEGRVRKLTAGGDAPVVYEVPAARRSELGRPSTFLGVQVGIASDRDGNLFVAGAAGLVEVRPDGTRAVITDAADAWYRPADVVASGPEDPTPTRAPRLAVEPGGSVLVAAGRRVLRVDAGGRTVTVAGNGHSFFSGDGGPAVEAGTNAVDVAVGPAGAVLVADFEHHRVRRVDPDGLITTIAGGGATPGPDPITATRLAADRAGTVYVAEPSTARVRKVVEARPPGRTKQNSNGAERGEAERASEVDYPRGNTLVGTISLSSTVKLL